jgi:hypothetical protein
MVEQPHGLAAGTERQTSPGLIDALFSQAGNLRRAPFGLHLKKTAVLISVNSVCFV